MGKTAWGAGGLLLGLVGGYFIGHANTPASVPREVLTDFGNATCAPGEAERPDPPSSIDAVPKGPEPTANDKRSENNKPPIERKALEASAELLNNETEIESFLKGVRYQNFFEALRQSRPLDPKAELEVLNGRFHGEVVVKAQSPWEMFVEAYLRGDGEDVKGKVAIQLAKDGKVFSNLSGDGNIRAYRRAGGDSLALIVEASQEHYFQMYYLPQMDAFVGNYYEQTSPGVLVPKGTVRLNRG
ncbi:MAG: hypothetical protein H6617_09785 [Bdellovibrionaceae bacterium]|nr:hypothetical protein [Bdellovibrionales bacterium]MCB9254960.1 hypothetical protein [Pseudobdellovibrionaceae bacterium]